MPSMCSRVIPPLSIRIKLETLRQIIEADHIAENNRDTAILPDMSVVISDWRGVSLIKAVLECRLKS